MPKLKLSGRKLCTTGRKLAVCGCGLTPCCENGGHCRFVNTTNTRRVKAWYSFSYSTVLLDQSDADKFPVSGTCEGSGEFLSNDTTSDTTGVLRPCRAAVGTTDITNKICTPPAGTTSDIRLNYIRGTSGFLGAGANGTQAATQLLSFAFAGSFFRIGNFNISAGLGLQMNWGFNNGTPTYTIVGNNWPNGTVTVTPIFDVLCIVGARVDFDLSAPNGQDTTRTISGYAVVAICDKFVGCNGTGIACGASPPGSSAALTAALDDALFS